MMMIGFLGIFVIAIAWGAVLKGAARRERYLRGEECR